MSCKVEYLPRETDCRYSKVVFIREDKRYRFNYKMIDNGYARREYEVEFLSGRPDESDLFKILDSTYPDNPPCHFGGRCVPVKGKSNVSLVTIFID